MKTYLLLRILLAVHLSGIVMMAGATMMDYITFRTFWKFSDGADNRGAGLLPLMAKYGGLIRTGGAIIIITGISMLAISKGAWGNQLWFKIKIALVFLLVMNGMFIGNKYGGQLRNQITKNAPDFLLHTSGLRTTLHRFYIIQLSIFILIILASTIKFDTPANS